MDLNATYWDTRHLRGETGWDIKMVSPPLKSYFDAPIQELGHVLIPGCGQAYEAEYLLQIGCSHVAVLDFAPSLVKELSTRLEGTSVQVICDDVFKHTGRYDTIAEQTLFCAIDPSQRIRYINQIADLLQPNGIWFGVLFDREFEKEGPPFGGSVNEYESLLSIRFELLTMEKCTCSIPQRMGTEVFFIARKK
jgi:methyl halide transferase